MPRFSNAGDIFELEIGAEYEGWKLTAVVCNDTHAAVGGYTFQFARNGQFVSILNDNWPQSQSTCFNRTRLCVEACPTELRIFSYRTMKLLSDTDRQSAQGES